MKHGRILDAELSRAIAMMGHGDIFMVCGTIPDEWFAIPGTVMPESYRQRRERMRKP